MLIMTLLYQSGSNVHVSLCLIHAVPSSVLHSTVYLLFALTLYFCFFLLTLFCVSEARASQWHAPSSCKTNNDWDLCGLSILSPFQCKTLRMESGEGRGSERSTGKVVVVRGRVRGGLRHRGDVLVWEWERTWSTRWKENDREAPAPGARCMLWFFTDQCCWDPTLSSRNRLYCIDSFRCVQVPCTT